ncbi:MAG: alkane 1-monooxygenase [Bacteroidetes bacterium]|nr:alkane 1-monooxygenase [Bacteroidota bacterium]MBS1632048.1 alkane 1-monooxygenase [Bacteroidota bacterium]
MSIRAFKYFSPFIIYLGAFRAFTTTGWQIWLPLAYAWFIIPLIELFIKPDNSNLSEAEEELLKQDKIYDALLYLVVPLQYAALFLFLYSMKFDKMTIFDIIGRIYVMGLCCGVFGINVAHELGHRVNRIEQILAKMLLLTSQYMHFFIEHNKGHHKRVATMEDPSSSRQGEWIYTFYFRSVILSYFSAWNIANKEMKKKNLPVLSLKNEMIQFSIIQVAFVALIFFLFGWLVTIYYLAAALIGILTLETVNYIEHYGLKRKTLTDGKYERVNPEHSWNSNHVLGRVMLFELSRHSDHHYLASRKYQILRHHDNSPQMPTGYPGMMILSLIPPAWFYIMDRRIKATG